MDDLDHSVHIAEVDWTRFYDESEECGGLLPALTCPDNLSDLEDSENCSSVFSEDQQVVAGCSTGEICVQSSMKVTDSSTGEPGTSATWVDSETGTYSPAGNFLITEEVHIGAEEEEEMMQTDTSHVQCSETSEEMRQEAGVLQTTRQGLNVIDRAAGDGVSSVSPRVEKERWFVTVNYSPARERMRPTQVKKKRRQKKHCKVGQRIAYGSEKSLENDVGLRINKDAAELTGGRELGGFTTSNHDLVQNSGGGDGPAETHPRSLIRRHSPKANVTEATMDQNKPDQGSSAPASHDPLMEPPHMQSMEPDECQDGADVASVHSYDSECYLSAAESLEETKHPLMVSVTLQTDTTQIRQTHSYHSSPCCKVAAASRDVHECTDAESALTFPSAGHGDNKMPHDTPGAHNDNTDLSASGSSSGDQLSCLPVPHLTVTACSAADSPESYAKSLGLSRPVFAISAFWDEMEKLTINDILQLRMDRSTSPGETRQTAATSVDESLTSQSSPADTVQYDLSDGGLMVEQSDTADSDYFTQPDESKPDQSSCEFSASDFEEEYWQFLSSRNSSPDPRSTNREGKRDSLSSSHEEEEEDSTSSEGTETLVPQESQIWSKLTGPRQMTKSKSMRNVQAFSRDRLTVAPGNDEGHLFPSRHQSLEENMTQSICDNLGILTPAPFLSGYNKGVLDGDDHTSFPEVSEYFYAKSDLSCVTVYDDALCTLKGDVSFTYHQDFLCSEDKPIPIFSCCHPTVRDITFPKFNNGARCKAEEEVGNIFPFRVWKCFPSLSSIHFHDRGSMWCRRVFPPDAERKDPPMPHVSATASQVIGELALQNILGTEQTTGQKGILSTLKQSDMCLVCIAFASWVLTSSDPENADAWKAALLANVSALSAIQYLRQYVLKKTSPQGDP